MPEGDWVGEVFVGDGPDGWFDLVESADHLIVGCANLVMPLAQAGENVVIARWGWGDGFYPVLTTHSDDGSLLGVHIDLLVDEAPS